MSHLSWSLWSLVLCKLDRGEVDVIVTSVSRSSGMPVTSLAHFTPCSMIEWLADPSYANHKPQLAEAREKSVVIQCASGGRWLPRRCSGWGSRTSAQCRAASTTGRPRGCRSRSETASEIVFPVCGASAGDIGQFVGVGAQWCKAEAKPGGGVTGYFSNLPCRASSRIGSVVVSGGEGVQYRVRICVVGWHLPAIVP
jgi:hypothetical protein